MEPSSRNEIRPTSNFLLSIDPDHHGFIKPTKMIHEGSDVSHFLSSKAYCDIGRFIMQLNISMCPRKIVGSDHVHTWQIDSPITLSEPVQMLQDLLRCVELIIEQVPPDGGPRRFGNVSFRKWYQVLESRVRDLLERHLPKNVLGIQTPTGGISVLDELTPYFLGSFGSAQRLDYGTGHELSFIAFLGCIWKLGGFDSTKSPSGSVERSLVIGVLEPYLRVVRRLISTYTLEPAGSHGVWGLDDHSFVSYIFGSAQYCPAITPDESMPTEGALSGSPSPSDVAKKNVVDRERVHNMYFSAVGFINDVKTGPFWEHSPMLFDISGVRSGWAKINKGMIKMYNAEVLSKFPVVQHFPFGSLFSWEQDPDAMQSSISLHASSLPTVTKTNVRSQGETTTPAPWAVNSLSSSKTSSSAPPTAANMPRGGLTRAPWAAAPTDNGNSQSRQRTTKLSRQPSQDITSKRDA